MAYRYGDRYQMNLFPQSIEDYVGPDDPVRAYDAFIEAIDLTKLGIALDDNHVGNPEYDPKAMLKLLVYGYSYGTRSSRKLERAVHHNVSFIWLMGGLRPDHKTISLFRMNNKKALANILKECAHLCIKLGLIEGNTLFVDGSKIRANASINNTWTKEKAAKCLKHIDQRINDILNECAAVDAQESNADSFVKLKEELNDKEALKSKIQNIMKELENEKKTSLNSTDPGCVKVKGRQGAHAGYNGQIVVDEKHGLIVHSDVVSDNTDVRQFAAQIEQANQSIKEEGSNAHGCKNACGDAGYACTDELKKIDAEGIKVIVPSQKQAHDREPTAFSKEQFSYNATKDCYVCPAGNEIPRSHFSFAKNCTLYRFTDPKICAQCRHFGKCTTSKRGRAIIRLLEEETKIKLAQQYRLPFAQAIYRLRKQKVELPFGHIKRNLGVNAFLLRGLKGVKAEMSLLGTCFNIARMITLIGVRQFTTGFSA
jgi:transposase